MVNHVLFLSFPLQPRFSLLMLGLPRTSYPFSSTADQKFQARLPRSCRPLLKVTVLVVLDDWAFQLGPSREQMRPVLGIGSAGSLVFTPPSPICHLCFSSTRKQQDAINDIFSSATRIVKLSLIFLGHLMS